MRCLLSLILLSALPLYADFTILDLGRSPHHPEPEIRHLRYRFTLENPSNRAIPDAHLWTYAPVKHASTQQCLRIQTSHNAQLIEDEMGNQVLYFRLKNLAPYSAKIITVQAKVAVSNSPQAVDSSAASLCLDAEQYIEADHSEVVQLAHRLAMQEPTSTARNVFKWIDQNIREIRYVSEDRGALWALRNRSGDCTEMAFLFVALCRAVGIPARVMGGYICEYDTLLRSRDYHNWAEFFDGQAWKTVDPQLSVFEKNSSKYVAFECVTESKKNPMGNYHRFRFKGDGLKVRMN